MQVPDKLWGIWILDTLPQLMFCSPSLLIRGTASDVAGIISETLLRNTVSERRIVTSEIGNDGGQIDHGWQEERSSRETIYLALSLCLAETWCETNEECLKKTSGGMNNWCSFCMSFTVLLSASSAQQTGVPDWLTQGELLPRIWRQREAEQRHRGDENTGHDQVEEIVQSPPPVHRN